MVKARPVLPAVAAAGFYRLATARFCYLAAFRQIHRDARSVHTAVSGRRAESRRLCFRHLGELPKRRCDFTFWPKLASSFC